MLSKTTGGVTFSELMQVMSTLADAGSDKGHIMLFQSATEWIEVWYVFVSYMFPDFFETFLEEI